MSRQEARAIARELKTQILILGGCVSLFWFLDMGIIQSIIAV